MTDSHPSFRQPKMAAIFRQQLGSKPLADPEPDDFAKNCRKACGRDQKPNIEVMGSGGEDRSRNQSRLGRQRKPNAFERNERRPQPDAVAGYELHHPATLRPACLILPPGGCRPVGTEASPTT